MKKTNNMLLVLLALQALIIMGMRVGGEDVKPRKNVDVLENFDSAKVTRLKILGAPQEKADGPPQNSVEIAKVGATWGIASAENYPADGKKVDDLLAKLKAMKSRDTVVTKSTYHKKLEVSAEKFQRKLTFTHDGKEHVLYVGSAPKFKSQHVRLDGKDEVHLVSDFSASDVGDRAWHWINKDYVKYDKKDVWAIKVQNAKGLIEIKRDPSNDEWIAPAVTKKLKKTAVEDIVRKASTINLDTPMGKTDKPEYGMAAPLATITLVTGTSTIAGVPPPTTETHTIKVGAKTPKENRYYLKADTSEYIVQVQGYAVQNLVQNSVSDLIEEEKTETPKK